MTFENAKPARLRGGRADGRTIEVEPTRQIVSVIVSETERHYDAGEFSPGSGPVTATVIEQETYRRVDADTFEPYFDPPRV